MKKHIYKIIGLPLALSSLVYMGFYVADNELNSYPEVQQEEAKFYNGQVLYPDYVCSDTLVVINEALLNDEIGKCDGSDGSYSDLLGEGCVNIADYNSYMDLAGNGK